MACGGPRAVLCQETGVGATGHVAVPELPQALVAGARATTHTAILELSCARRQEPGPQGTWWLQSCHVPGDGSRGTRGHVRPSCLSSLT
jgi:hypothetical protein